MLYIGIPAYNEATTIGVLLWRLRSVLADVSREYEVVVYDDASTDQTAETLAPYTRVLPLTVLRGAERVGYGRAVDAIARHVAKTTRYPRRDALLLLQGDFTDPPALVPEFLRRFEGGADLILGERTLPDDAPQPVRRLWKAARWVLRPFVGITDVRDLTASYRLVRIAVLRDLIKASADAPISAGDFWNANADFALRAAALARRVETIPVTPTYQVRTRATRRTAWPDTIALAKWAWSRRGDRVAVRVIARTAELPEPVTEEPASAEPTERSTPEPRARAGRSERASRPERKPRRERSGANAAKDQEEPQGRGRRARPESGRDETRVGGPGADPTNDVPTGAGAPAGAPAGADGETTGEAASEETRARRTRPRRRRGGRKDRPTGESPEAGEDAATTSDASGEVVSDERTAGERFGEERTGEERTGEERTGDPVTRAEGDTTADSDPATPRRRKRSRRGRRKRPDGEARLSDDAGNSSRVRSDDATGNESNRAGESEPPRNSRSADRPEGADGSEASEGTAAPKRRRSRRGRRGGARRRDEDSPPRDGPSAEGSGEPGPRQGEPESRGESD